MAPQLEGRTEQIPDKGTKVPALFLNLTENNEIAFEESTVGLSQVTFTFSSEVAANDTITPVGASGTNEVLNVVGVPIGAVTSV